MFEVIVSNIGSVYTGNNFRRASAKFNSYVKASKVGTGRAGGENVVMMHNNEMRREYVVIEGNDHEDNR